MINNFDSMSEYDKIRCILNSLMYIAKGKQKIVCQILIESNNLVETLQTKVEAHSNKSNEVPEEKLLELLNLIKQCKNALDGFN